MRTLHPTLVDVAAAAGVSRSQASRALRGDPGVTEITREKVRDAARHLGYQANVAARALASSRSSTIGVVIGEPMNPSHMMIASEIAELSRAAGLDPIIAFGKLGRDIDMTEAERLLSHRAAGAIMIATPVDLARLAAFNAKLPVVYIGGDVSSLGIRCVHNDDVGGAREATEHLINLGHRHIAHISGGTNVITSKRVQGYQQAMRDAGLTPIVQPAWLDIDGGRAGVDALMVLPTRPTAIFAGNDRIAIGAINRLRGLGYRVPEDVSVAGFDNIIDASSESLSLTTLDQHPALMARESVKLMNEILDSESTSSLARIVPVDLIIRRSTSHPSQ